MEGEKEREIEMTWFGYCFIHSALYVTHLINFILWQWISELVPAYWFHTDVVDLCSVCIYTSHISYIDMFIFSRFD